MAHDGAMSAILYPVAANAEEALAGPRGRVARQKDAAQLAEGPVSFVTEDVGGAFASREAALDAYPGRLDDERPDLPRGVRARLEGRDRALDGSDAQTEGRPPERGHRAQRHAGRVQL